MKDYFKVSKEFIELAHASACETWKGKIEREIPELFQGLEINEWYKCKERPHFLVRLERKTNRGLEFGIGYGIGYNGFWDDDIRFLRDFTYVKASRKETQEAVVKACMKKGLVVGARAKDVEDGGTSTISDYYLSHYDGNLYSEKSGEGGIVLFRDGKFATVVDTKIQDKINKLEKEISKLKEELEK